MEPNSQIKPQFPATFNPQIGVAGNNENSQKEIRPQTNTSVTASNSEVEELTGTVLDFEEALTPQPAAVTPALGTSPNQMSPKVSAAKSRPQAEVKALLFRPSQPPGPFELSKLKHYLTDDENFVWIDLTNYTQSDLRNIARQLELHPVALKATLEEWQRPRFDNFRTRQHYFVSVTVAHLNPTTHQVLAAELDLFLGNNVLLSVHKTPVPFMAKITERAIQSPELVKLDAAFMLFIVLDELLEYYEELSDHLEIETEKMELQALKDTSDSFLSNLVQLKRYIFALTRLVDQHRKVFAVLVRPDNLLTRDDEVAPYFQDLETHFERLMDTLQPAKEAVNGAFDIYVSAMAHKTNQIIKTLTILPTFLLPTTIIISLFGTNIVGLSQNEVIDFSLMLAAILITSVIIVLVFRRMRWL